MKNDNLRRQPQKPKWAQNEDDLKNQLKNEGNLTNEEYSKWKTTQKFRPPQNWKMKNELKYGGNLKRRNHEKSIWAQNDLKN